MSQIKNITVFASSSTRADQIYLDAAEKLGQLLAERGLTLVFGGGGIGLMGALHQGAKAAGGSTIGITTTQFVQLEQAVPDCDELIVVETMAERKKKLIERGDAILVLPGGLGTYEEFFDAFVGRVLGHHNKAMVLVNIEGALDLLCQMIDDGIERKFINQGVREFLHVFATGNEAIDHVLNSTEHAVDPSKMVPSGDWEEPSH